MNPKIAKNRQVQGYTQNFIIRNENTIFSYCAILLGFLARIHANCIYFIINLLYLNPC